MKLEDVKKALGKSVEKCAVSVEEKTVVVDYPSLVVCGEISQEHLLALKKLGTVASAEQDALGLAAAPKFPSTDNNAFQGPQRLTVRFV